MTHTDIVCFCHLRWNFVYQRPQHLLSRFAKQYRVFVIEDPCFDAPYDRNDISQDPDSCVWVVTPNLTSGKTPEDIVRAQRRLLDMLMHSMNIGKYLLWYYSPMALPYSNHLTPESIIYDCMDELSGFKFAPASLQLNERKLFGKADLVFTGGHNLYQAKKHLHTNIHPFPSSIDKQHFYKARGIKGDTEDQKDIPHPRIGFYGVVDERFNIDLLEQVSGQMPEWHFVIIGPVVKIDPATLPQRANIHYLGAKDYKVLPEYLAGWDIAMMPFALNEATTYISPTKTPEYLAGGKPVISTSIRDVVVPYGEQGLVSIADNCYSFVAAAEDILSNKERDKWLGKVDGFLSNISWDKTWQKMHALVESTLNKKIPVQTNKEAVYV